MQNVWIECLRQVESNDIVPLAKLLFVGFCDGFLPQRKIPGRQYAKPVALAQQQWQQFNLPQVM
jgi:hypothetical protein